MSCVLTKAKNELLAENIRDTLCLINHKRCKDLPFSSHKHERNPCFISEYRLDFLIMWMNFEVLATICALSIFSFKHLRTIVRISAFSTLWSLMFWTSLHYTHDCSLQKYCHNLLINIEVSWILINPWCLAWHKYAKQVLSKRGKEKNFMNELSRNFAFNELPLHTNTISTRTIGNN